MHVSKLGTEICLSTAEIMGKIAAQIRACAQCPLSKNRTNAVPGEGSLEAKVFFVGEAPGYWEDVKGLPFVGSAGKVLDGLLTGIGLARESVFITSVVKCRPPRNREPRPAEIETCTSLYLNRQINLVKPKVVVTLGKHSTAYVLSKAGFDTVLSITDLHGKVSKVKFLGLSLVVLPMFHPASVLHNPIYKEALENDFCVLRKELRKRRIA
jgi:DNA polymerase